MNKQLYGFLFVMIMTVFVAAPIVAEEKQNQIKINENNSSEAEIRASGLQEIEQLISLTQKLSSDLRSDVKNTKSRQGDSVKEEKKAALNLSDKLEGYILQLNNQKDIIKNTNQSVGEDLKKTLVIIKTIQDDLEKQKRGFSDLGQKLQFQLQEANNIYSRANKAITNLIQKDNETKNSIIQNIKG
jgi:hypothetical protein